MAAVEVILPKVDMDMESGVIAKWLVQEGQRVEEGTLLFEMETGKAMMEVESPSAGVIRDLAPVDGRELPVGTQVAWIDP
ncbi:MAG: biotin/lipoyl-binding protein [Burkholderiales bacterium]|jgi:pyruvate dehydrogenase E2 component (dihydrolipoamide acetyltransferase)|nr:biotin/lipoyl-binding protein [Burkholderiales bacterium]